MFSKKINKSEEYILLATRGCKVPEGKIALKKSLPLISPKASAKITSGKNLFKPGKKENKVLSQNIASVSSIPELKSITRLERPEKRSKSRVIISHLSCDKWKGKEEQKQ